MSRSTTISRSIAFFLLYAAPESLGSSVKCCVSWSAVSSATLATQVNFAQSVNGGKSEIVQVFFVLKSIMDQFGSLELA